MTRCSCSGQTRFECHWCWTQRSASMPAGPGPLTAKKLTERLEQAEEFWQPVLQRVEHEGAPIRSGALKT